MTHDCKVTAHQRHGKWDLLESQSRTITPLGLGVQTYVGIISVSLNVAYVMGDLVRLRNNTSGYLVAVQQKGATFLFWVMDPGSKIISPHNLTQVKGREKVDGHARFTDVAWLRDGILPKQKEACVLCSSVGQVASSTFAHTHLSAMTPLWCSRHHRPPGVCSPSGEWPHCAPQRSRS